MWSSQPRRKKFRSSSSLLVSRASSTRWTSTSCVQCQVSSQMRTSWLTMDVYSARDICTLTRNPSMWRSRSSTCAIINIIIHSLVAVDHSVFHWCMQALTVYVASNSTALILQVTMVRGRHTLLDVTLSMRSAHSRLNMMKIAHWRKLWY